MWLTSPSKGVRFERMSDSYQTEKVAIAVPKDGLAGSPAIARGWKEGHLPQGVNGVSICGSYPLLYT
jgi:hypothetical protein